MAESARIRITRVADDDTMGRAIVPPMERLMNAMLVRAQRLVPKRTRNLLRTLTVGVEQDGAVVTGHLGAGGAVNGSLGAKYWDYVERGTSRMAAQPYLRPALYQTVGSDLGAKIMPQAGA